MFKPFINLSMFSTYKLCFLKLHFFFVHWHYYLIPDIYHSEFSKTATCACVLIWDDLLKITLYSLLTILYKSFGILHLFSYQIEVSLSFQSIIKCQQQFQLFFSWAPPLHLSGKINYAKCIRYGHKILTYKFKSIIYCVLISFLVASFTPIWATTAY